MPPPDEHLIRELIREYARESGTAGLIDDTAVANILAEGIGRNPRRIKRIINSFVLQYSLDPAWQKPPLSSVLLVTAIVIQHLYAPFYDLFVSEEAVENPIVEFLDYVRVREKLPKPPTDGEDPWWKTVGRSFAARQIQAPESSSMDTLKDHMKELEGLLPADFMDLAKNNAFIVLLRRVEESGASDHLRAQLVRRPLATTHTPTARLTGNERKHLENLRVGSTSNYSRNEFLQTDLRRLREMGLIKSKRNISEMPNEFDLSDWVELTDRGYDYIRRQYE